MARHGSPSLRIGAGIWRGRKILSAPGWNTRPMTAMAKKSLFGILAGRLEGAVVLDLYCGTGTLGLEALSHGAKRCVFAERDGSVLDRLRRNIAACGAETMSLLWPGDVERTLASRLRELGEKADIVFVDPPFPAARRWDWPRMVETFFSPLAGALAEEGLVVLRLPGEVPAPEVLGPLALRRICRYGDMTISFYGVTASA